jgi:hypothetical protein
MSLFTFTETEKTLFNRAYNTGLGAYQANNSAENVWTNTYDTLLGILETALVNEPSRFDEEDRTVAKWVVGARTVNGGSGLYTDFIREYTNTQYAERYGEAAPATKAQEASNGVAANFLGDVFRRLDRDDLTDKLATLAETGLNDAGGAASVVFDGAYAPWAVTCSSRTWAMISSSMTG